MAGDWGPSAEGKFPLTGEGRACPDGTAVPYRPARLRGSLWATHFLRHLRSDLWVLICQKTPSFFSAAIGV